MHAGRWPGRRQEQVNPDRDYKEYSLTPYQNHQDYVNDIFDVTIKYSAELKRTNSKGKTLRQILINGSAYSHFRYLQNGNRAIFSLTPKQRQLHSFGTSANESLHQQFNTSQRQVIQQHVESTKVVLKSFSFGKLLAHHSAAFDCTMSQRSQGQILALLEGHLLSKGCSFCKPWGEEQPLPAIAARRQLRKPIHRRDQQRARVYSSRKALQEERWRQHLRLKPRKRRHVLKRHIFTKKKEPKRKLSAD